jgi:hypothetical protein
LAKLTLIGGIIGLIGGGLMFLEIFRRLELQKYGWIFNLVLASLVILASLLGMKEKRIGGELLIVIAGILILIGILTLLTPVVDILPYSVVGRFGIVVPAGNAEIVAGIPLETFIIIVGGFLVLASPQTRSKSHEGIHLV